MLYYSVGLRSCFLPPQRSAAPGTAFYRFLKNDQVYLGGRYNVASGELLAFSNQEVSSTRIEVGGGWFVTPNILVKAEYAQQTWDDYPAGSLFHGGEFSGFTLEGVVAF